MDSSEGQMLSHDPGASRPTPALHINLAIDNSADDPCEHHVESRLRIAREIAEQAVILEDLDAFLRVASDLIRQEFNCQRVQIWTLGPRQERFFLAGSAQRAPEDKDPQSLLESTAEQESSNQYLGPGVDGKAINSESPFQLTLPIRLRGRILGILSLEAARPGAFAQEIQALESVASLLACAFGKFRVAELGRQSTQYLQAILEAAQDMAILSTDIHGYVITCSAGAQSIFQRPLQEVVGADIFSFFTDTGFQRAMALHMHDRVTPPLRRNGLLQSSAKLKRYLDVIFQPVQDPNGRVFGFLCVARDVTQNVLLQRSLESMSITDELTGLYNQRYFSTALTSELQRCRRFNRNLALCFIDMDHFKRINDTHGHLRGDQVLSEMAAIMRSLLRAEIDSCYRYGGDEFIVLLPETSKGNAVKACDRIRRKLNEHFQGEVTLSIGIADMSDCASTDVLIERADKAMYEAKSRGGDCIVISEETTGGRT